MKLVWMLFFFLVFCACTEDKTKDSIPVITLNPDEAGLMKTTEYFDHYEAVALKDVLSESILDVVEFPDCWLALHARAIYKNFLYVYDKQGQPLHPVGETGRGAGEYQGAGMDIYLEKDSTIRIYDSGFKHLKFNIQGDLLEEKFQEELLDIKYGSPVHYLDDTTLLCHNRGFYFYLGNNRVDEERSAKQAKGNFLLNIVPLSPGREIISYGKGEELYKFALNDYMYLYRDTCHFYIEKASEIFQVIPSGIVPRYRIDRGEYQGFQTKAEMLAQIKLKKILMQSINETEKYVLGIYLFDGCYYIFIYDKKSRQTHNYKTVDDDLLEVGTKKSKYFPSLYFRRWLGKRHFNEQGLIILYSPKNFGEMIEYVRGKMQPEEWERYSKEHPDLIRIYNELDDNTNVVILKYCYK